MANVLNLKSGQPTILLADTNIAQLDKNAALLQEIGLFNHLHAENGSEAMAMFKNFTPDILILSQELPDISGLSLLSMVRQLDVDLKTTVILYSSNVNNKLLIRAGRFGVDNILSFPYADDTFQQKIIETIQEPGDSDVEKVDHLVGKCQEQMNKGNYEDALVTCNEILDIHENAEIFYNLGYILSIRGNFEEALSYFKKATKINSQHARAFKQMGLIYQKLGRIQEAQGCLERAADLHLVLNEENEAEEILNTVLTLRPDTTNVYNSLGIIYRHQGRLDEAIKAYEKAIKVHPTDENIYFNLSRVYLDKNDKILAKETLKQALSLNPGFVAAQDLLRAAEMGLRLKTGEK
ncbi:MAG: tetratricopeptide repeat protein [Deltaproteobacteria bacterium]|nr:tetratricopeptide repeat protein [Deltaproteobacteria bacterium]